jgi:PAS domain S-box-containing protein
VSVVLQTLIVMMATFFAVGLFLNILGVAEGGIREWYEILLTCMISLAALYQTTLRPLSRLAAEHAAASAEARFEAIAHAAGDAIVILDADWKVHFANRATEKMLGIPAGAWEKTPLEAILPEDSKQFLQEARTQYRETGKPVLSMMGTIELGLLRSDGSRLPAEVRVSEFRDGQQTLFVAMLRDISARKHAEHEIQERTTRLNALLANSPLGMVVLDKNHRVQMCNPAFEELFQYRSAEIAGLELDTLVASEELQEEASDMTKAGMRGQVAHAITRRRRKDGSLVDVEVYGVPMLIGGQLEGSYAIYQDISERKKLQLYEQMLPVCCMCGKIRDDQGLAPGQGPWDRLDRFISKHSDAKLTHTFCPECLAQYRKEQGI